MAAILNTSFRTALAQSIVDDIQTKSSRYYYFLGKTLDWSNNIPTDVAYAPEQHAKYENETRNNIIFFKQVLPTDVSFVIPRINWISGTVYDAYDDNLHTTTQTGTGTVTCTTSSATLTGTSTYFTEEIRVGDVIRNSSNELIGTVSSVNSNTSITLSSNAAVAVTGAEYTYTTSIESTNGATSTENSNFYVMNDLFSVYKCIDNNFGAESTAKPTGTSTSVITTADGYKWKFMYNIPASLRNKFLTAGYMPVINAIRNQFYSAGEITTVIINNGGSSYTSNPTITVSGDGYLADNPYILTSVTITDGGYGYDTAPTLTVDDPSAISGDEETAEISCTIDGDGIVDTVSIDVVGYGYETAPLITVSEPVTPDSTWMASTSYTLSQIIKYAGNYYEVTSAGTSSSTPPTHTSGAETLGTVEFTYVATIATLTAVMTKTEALLTAVVEGGVITDIIIDDGGIGYTYATISVTDSSGSGASLSADLSTGDANTLQASVELLATPGTIDRIQLTNQGADYAGVPSVTIEGDGTGATAVAVLSTTSTIDYITVTNTGTGYTYADVTITGGGGTGAKARAVISPIDGHGKNAIDELNCRELMFYTNISNEKNQNFIVNNDYRQIGLIRNPESFDSTARFRNITGSTCYVINATINTSNFENDMEVTLSGTDYKFKIIAVESTRALLLPVNKGEPVSGSVFVNSDLDTFTALTVENPTIDKFSGQLFFIDNKDPFTPTDIQSVTNRTIIRV